MSPDEFKARRRQLMRMMGENAIAILPSAPVRARSRDIDYPYRQDSDFYYVTGFAEPESVAVLIPDGGAGQFVLFCREQDEHTERWEGGIHGLEGAMQYAGADNSFPIADIDDILPGMIEPNQRVYFTMGAYPEFDSRLTDWLNMLRQQSVSGGHTPHEFIALDHFLHDMRLYKSRKEVTALRRAAKVTVGAHRRALAAIAPGVYEYEIEAEFDYEFRRHNARHAYPPIVGGGHNACALHYGRNDQPLKAGELVLIDAGCELDYYACDVTRTAPVSGQFSAEQKTIYELVLTAQQSAIDAALAEASWNSPHEAAFKVISDGLCELGILRSSPSEALERREAETFFMHRTGHWLGIDVHDVGDYRVGAEWRMLEPGMVTTVEPGIYISADADVDKRWQGIGVRVEDVVVVTRDQPLVLTQELPKTVAEIEAAIGG